MKHIKRCGQILPTLKLFLVVLEAQG